MKNILTNSISDPNILQPITGHSMKFLQDATKEQIVNLMQIYIGDVRDNGTPYVLWGCVKSTGGSPFSYTEGAIYINGEIYDMPAFASVPITVADICTITTTNDGTADPLTFSDGTPRNVHNHRDIVIANGALGTGSFNYEDVVFLQNRWIERNVLADVTPAGGGTLTVTTANVKYFIERKTLTMIFTATGTITSTNVTSIVFAFPAATTSDTGFTYRDTCSVGSTSDTPTTGSGRMSVNAGAGQIDILPHWNWANVYWANGSTFEIGGQLTIPIF
jgi:hypothetical protein